MNRTTDERIKEACGVFGIFNPDGEDAAGSICYGLASLQHRGQESCGIAVCDTNGLKGNMKVHKGMGLVHEVFKESTLAGLTGNLGVGHVRYSTTGAAVPSNAQPLVLNYIKGTLALAHNGNLVNTEELREELARTGAIFQTTTDSEVIAYEIARARVHTHSTEEIRQLIGADSLGYMRVEDLSSTVDGLPLCRACFDNHYPMEIG